MAARICSNEEHLREIFSEYVDYYNKNRSHQSLDLDAPLVKFGEPESQIVPAYEKVKMVRGTVTEFSLAS